MEKFKHTKRSSFLFFLYACLTLGITSIVTLERMRKEYNRMTADKEGIERQMSYVGVYFLGWITLGIVPLVWLCRLAGRYGELGREQGMEKPKLTGTNFICWLLIGSLIIIGPWLAFRKLFKISNALQIKANEAMDKAAEVAALPAPVEEVKEEPVVEEKPCCRYADPIERILKKYEGCKEGRFAVRFSKCEKAVRTFEKKECAVAFAKEVAAARRVQMRYVKLK